MTITAKTVLDNLGSYLEHDGKDAARESARIARLINGAARNHDKVDKALEEIGKILDAHGVEPIRDENANDRYYGDIVALYVNMGDPYVTTVLYDTVNESWHVTGWGEWYEEYERELDEEEGGKNMEERSKKSGYSRRHGQGEKTQKISKESVMRIAGDLSNRFHGSTPKHIEGGYRWSDWNESAKFTTYSPEQNQEVVVVVSLFDDGTMALNFFSDEGLSGASTYENISHFNYDTVDLDQMTKDVKWVQRTVDGYAASRDDERGGEMEERRLGAKTHPVDDQAARELVMYIENESDLSPDGPRGQGHSVLLNALRKWRKGTYDPELAVRLFEYLAEAGAKRYAKEFGGQWSTMFTPATRREAARQLEESFRSSAKNGEYDRIETRIARETVNDRMETGSQRHFINGWNRVEKGIQVWVSGDEPARVSITSSRANDKGRAFTEEVVQEWWGAPLHFNWTDTVNADISRDYTRSLRENTVRDYAAVDRNDRVIAGPSRDRDEMKRRADRAGGYVKFVPSGGRPKRAPPPPSSYPIFRESNGNDQWMVRFVHKISSSSKDTMGPVTIPEGAFSDSKTLAAALRRAKILLPGARIRSFRVEGDKVIVFPTMPGLTTYWHSIILTHA